MNITQRILLCCVTVMSASTVACSQGNAAAGEARAVTCLGCHGDPVRATSPNIPRIAGQSQVYLAKQLRDYRDGKRSDPSMSPIAATLDEAQIDDIAAWFSSLEFCADPKPAP